MTAPTSTPVPAPVALSRRQLLAASGASAALLGLGGVGTAATASASGSAVSPARRVRLPIAKTLPNDTSAVPIPAGQVEAAISDVDRLARALMKKSAIPGMAVAVVHGGRTVFARGYGVRKAGQPGEVNADTVFQLASVSKAVGATVVAHEVGAGRVAWDDPLSKHLPWFDLQDPYVGKHATIGDVYAHRSGLPPHIGDLLEEMGYSRREILRRLRFAPLDAFRTSYHYGNAALTAGGEATAAAAGKDWATLSRDVLYRPLGMNSTSSRFIDFVHRTNHAAGHVNINGRWVARYLRDSDESAPAGGVSSSVNDMAKWLAMVLGGGTYRGREIAPTAALLPALTAQSVANPAATDRTRPGFYGFGFNVSIQSSARMQLSHSGAFSLGAATTVSLIPSADVAIVTLTNAPPLGVPETLNAEFNDLVQYGRQMFDWWGLYSSAYAAISKPFGRLVGTQPPKRPVPAKSLTSYVGTYHNDFYGPLRIVSSGGRLRLIIGPDHNTFALRHWTGDEFAFGLRQESAEPGSISAVNFSADAGGHVTSLTVEFYNDFDLGTFAR